ncbi:MAG TPA: DUF4012 domain-containing protein [Candidatus Saccharimonadales bacterium]|nr:DUF4012 domain-containing protein [Candidatus Saccharimonadales bacterium]
MRNNPTVYVFSDANTVSVSLINELLKNSSYKVIVVTNHKEYFGQIFSGYSNLKISDFKEDFSEIPSYLFLIQGFLGQSTFFNRTQLRQVFDMTGKWLPKTEVVLPYLANDKNAKEIEYISSQALKVKNRNLQVVYTGEIYGAGMNLSEDGYIASIFRNVWMKNNISIPQYNFQIYLTNINELTSLLIKGIFSYGFDQKEVVVAKKMKVFSFLERVRKNLPKYVNYVTDRSIKSPGNGNTNNFSKVKVTNTSLKRTIDWINKNREGIKPGVVSSPIVKTKNEIKKPKFKSFVLVIIILLWILSLPFFSLFASSIFLKKGFNDLYGKHYTSALPLFNVSEKLSSFSLQVFGSIGFRDGREISSTLGDASEIGKRAVGVIATVDDLSQKVTGDTDYDLKGISQKLYLDLDDLHTRVSFLMADFSSFSGSRLFLPGSDFGKISDYLENARGIAQNLPQLLGQEKPASYLLLLQDTGDLRATGGAISSLGVFTFDKGKLTEKSFFDVAQIDEQLKGHIEPPAEIRKYLDKTEWRLIDSNWDPDFRTSGCKAEWFLEREIDRFVNGVVAVNLKTYNEMKSFDGNFMEWSNRLLTGLNSKDVQIFFNDNLLSTELENLHWDGGVNDHSIGIVETNLGQSVDITQSASLIVDLTGADIQSRLDISLRNNSTIYSSKSYLKLILPSGSNLNGESSTLVEMAPGESRRLTFSWINKKNLDYTRSGEFLLTLRKQSGLTFPMDVRFILPEFLTMRNLSRYNTSLDRDLDLTVKW